MTWQLLSLNLKLLSQEFFKDFGVSNVAFQASYLNGQVISLLEFPFEKKKSLF